MLMAASMHAQQWTTLFAYNNVTQIAMTPDRVYALSDGSLYSVEKQSEQIRIYNSLSGLHSTGISCIHYDDRSAQLIIGYKTGKIDLLSDGGVRYIGDLYDKDMTQQKTINKRLSTILRYTIALLTCRRIMVCNYLICVRIS